MKPISLCGRAILNSSERGDIVSDPFGGSGSTLMAADQLGRKCYTMELDPRYASVIVMRYAAEHGSDGVSVLRDGQSIPFAEIAPALEGADV